MMPKTDKTREEIKAEREAKKLAKQAKKHKSASTNEQPLVFQLEAAASVLAVPQEQSIVNYAMETETTNTVTTDQQPSAVQDISSAVRDLDNEISTMSTSEIAGASCVASIAAECPDTGEDEVEHYSGPLAQPGTKGSILDSEQPNVSDAFKLVDGVHRVQEVADLSHNQISISGTKVSSASEQSNTSDAVKLVDGIHTAQLASSDVDLSIVVSDGQVSLTQINDQRARVLSKPPVTIHKRINASDDEKVKERSAIMNQRPDSATVAPRPGEKTKAELRAERRAKQEAQRAAKLQSQQRKTVDQKEESKSKSEKQSTLSKDKVPNKSNVNVAVSKVTLGLSDVQHKVKLFNHLYLHQKDAVSAAVGGGIILHPAIVRLGIQYKSRVITGSNSRCVALLHAVKQVIEDYHTPSQQEFSRGLESCLRCLTTYLHACRPLPVSATNALRHLKWQLTLLPNNVTDADAKKKLHDSIETYIREQIDVADQAICNTVLDKITNGDTILTYGCSSLITRILLKAHESRKKFQVVVADGRPWLEGREMLRRLLQNGLKCSYVLLPAASFIMREVTKVFLGAHALLANGYVMSRAGSSQIALLAHTYNVPVLVCCETHKFSERVQTDSFVYNEIGDPDALGVPGWHEVGCLTPLNLTYDVTPPDLVTAVVTELSILPCTSVPVILRIKPSEAGF